ncbi:hypothetical protein CAPTEDRAFT_195243 [Capitella teleta]|uniref:Integrase zinc-binding domain-containing protein n=1 Tax=Capitella teleta TaxID=283909 RepID=R7VG76_CAPTE|nr:hypothetical protein CAPTEDRAFT_195243 [Capitella teleta]|eukprot:ELU17577.1 hypothetical protein CAPTEDRAFT_195243 [Capitella teleta]
MCNVRLAGLPIEVLVCESLGVDILIGSDLCRSAVIDFKNGLLTLGNQKFPMQTVEKSCFSVVAVSCIPRAPQAVVNDVAYRDIFSVKATPVNVARSLPPAVIDTGDHPPIKQPSYRMPLLKRQKVEDCVTEMLRDEIIRPTAIEPSTPTPVVVPADIPDVWVTDRIDLHDLARRQKEQFCDAYVEASQETDESPYIVQGSLLFTMAEPSRNAGRYLLPQQFRQQVIDRCHAEEEGERLQAIRLAERILREYRSKQKETYRENEPSRAKRLPPGTFVSVRILNPKKGETRWQPGYQVISSHDGALRVIELDTGNVVRINQRNAREIPESKPYDEINPLPPLKNQTTFDYVTSEAKPIPVVEESYLPMRIPRGPKRPSNDQPNLTTPSMPVPAVSAALAPSIVFPSDDWSSWCDFVFHFTH